MLNIIMRYKLSKKEQDLAAFLNYHLTYRIHVSPISLFLGMLKWVAINLTRTCEQKSCSNSLRQTQHIQGTHHISLVIAVKDLKTLQRFFYFGK